MPEVAFFLYLFQYAMKHSEKTKRGVMKNEKSNPEPAAKQSESRNTKGVSILNGKPEDGHVDDGNNITVFHRPSKNVLNFNLNHGEKQISLHLRSRKELIDLTFHEKMLSNRRYDTQNVDSEPSMESVGEQMWKPMTTETQKLLSTYLKLSKIRLTGCSVIFSLRRFMLLTAI